MVLLLLGGRRASRAGCTDAPPRTLRKGTQALWQEGHKGSHQMEDGGDTDTWLSVESSVGRQLVVWLNRVVRGSLLPLYAPINEIQRRTDLHNIITRSRERLKLPSVLATPCAQSVWAGWDSNPEPTP